MLLQTYKTPEPSLNELKRNQMCKSVTQNSDTVGYHSEVITKINRKIIKVVPWYNTGESH